ncbi:hypothetical protein [Streptomyces sp. G-G2]|uniref:hypothetical protein n=1 Tax=Streptomyces sp. G-G2 TaxID=3046201 RepID=UPI0024B91B05|nr:hypothetical protein [Streptomyces sp. G-G2]MDJ0386342.1 hypothetical protein [Streptomyces sp. G-G2]
MKRTAGLAVLALMVVLSACTETAEKHPAGEARPSPESTIPVRPTATTTVASEAAVALAERYRKDGGDADVYSIQKEYTPEGFPLLIIRTHNPGRDNERFRRLTETIVSFFSREEGVSLSGGYLMDVFGPDGSLRHRWDTTP